MACFRKQCFPSRRAWYLDRFQGGAQAAEPSEDGIRLKLLGNLPSQLCQMAPVLASKPLSVPPVCSQEAIWQ